MRKIGYMGKSPLPAKMNVVSPLRYFFRSIYELYPASDMKTSRERENEGKNLCDELKFNTVFCLQAGYLYPLCVV